MKKLILLLIVSFSLFCCNDEVVVRTSVRIEVLNSDESIPQNAKFNLTKHENNKEYPQDNGSNILFEKYVELGTYKLLIVNDNDSIKRDSLVIHRAYRETLKFNN